MGAVKEAMMDCMDMGYVPADAKRVGEWAGKLGSGRDDEIIMARMMAAVEALNHVFELGVEEVDA